MRRTIIGLGLALCACEPGQLTGKLSGAAGPRIAEETSPLAAVFEAAGARWNVPPSLLKAIAYRETGFVPAAGTSEFEGQPGAYGVFALRGDDLEKAAARAGTTVEEVRASPAVEIEAAAALLDGLASSAGIGAEDRAKPLRWRAALAAYGDLSEELRPGWVRDVLRVLYRGQVIELPDGTTLVIPPESGEPVGDVERTRGVVSAEIQGAGGAVYLPSPNWSRRSGGVELVVIHSCEGGYAGCVSWLRQSRAQASAHYVVKEDGTEIAQLVDEANAAWHVAARYRPWLNEGVLSGRSGQGVNGFSIGIEHGGFAHQREWPREQVAATVELVRGITERHGIPRDRYHIVSHGQLQPEDRTDPGPNWPWGAFISAIQSGGAKGGAVVSGSAQQPSFGRVGRNADGRLEVFARGVAGTLVHLWQDAETAWSPWSDQGVAIDGAPAVGSNADGRLEVFWLAPDGTTRHRWQATPGGEWKRPAILGDVLAQEPVVAANPDGRLEVFGVGKDGALWHRWQNAPNGGWDDWESLGGGLIASVAVAANHDGRLEVFARGTDGAVWHIWQLGVNQPFGAWESLGGPSGSSSPAVIANADGRLEVFAVDGAGAVHHRWQVAPSSAFSDGWAKRGGPVLAERPAVARNADGRLELFARAPDGSVVHTWQLTPSGGWSDWSSLGGVLSGPLAAAENADGRLELFARAPDARLWHVWQTSPNSGWSDWWAFEGPIDQF